MHRFARLFVLIVSGSALASQPRQPLDCSDWVFLVPGYSCSVWTPFPCEPDSNKNPMNLECVSGNEREFDNLGNRLRVEYDCISGDTSICPLGVERLCRVHLFARRDNTETEIAYIDDRCWSVANYPPGLDRVLLGAPAHSVNGKTEGRLVFDAASGRLLIPLRVECSDSWGQDDCLWPDASPHIGYWVAAITGLAPMREVSQSYVPSTNLWGFREPSFPDGLAGADHFDSYWGSVTQPLDLANAHPLQCAYPPTQPSIGDYLQITAPVPTPAPGHANYVLTSVTYQGQTRAGRKASGGRLSGRDASRLPACLE